MRRLPWTKLLLVGLLVCAAGICVRLVQWGTAPSADELQLTSSRYRSTKQECQRGTPPASVPVCRSVATFDGEGGRRFRFASAELLQPFYPDRPVEVLHTADGSVWEVRQAEEVVVSYEEIRRVRAEGTRVLRAFALIACVSLAGVTIHRGTRHLGSAPSCSCAACRGLDYATLAALSVGAVGVARGNTLVAAGGALVALLLFVIGIDRAVRRGHMTASSQGTAGLQDALTTLARRPTAWLRTWFTAGVDPPRLDAPWNLVSGLRNCVGTLGLFLLIGVSYQIVISVVIAQEPVERETWAILGAFVTLSAACLAAALLLSLVVRRRLRRVGS